MNTLWHLLSSGVQSEGVNRESATPILVPNFGGPASIDLFQKASPKATRRILLVEDDQVVRRCISRILVLAGYQVDQAEDGAEGWEAVHRNHYDLLITDNHMPRVSGLELIKRLRSVGMTLLIIMASGTLPREELENNPSLQLAAKLQKPFGASELLTVVDRVLGMPPVPAAMGASTANGLNGSTKVEASG